MVRDASPLPLTDERLTALKLHFASVAVHEFAHVRGMNHRDMPKYYGWSGGWKEYVAWAADFPLTVQPVRRTAAPTVDDKVAHVMAKLRLAETRLKRAKTLWKKWQRKHQYYVRKQAACGVKTNG